MYSKILKNKLGLYGLFFKGEMVEDSGIKARALYDYQAGTRIIKVLLLYTHTCVLGIILVSVAQW